MYLSQDGDDWSCGVGLAVWSTAVEDGNAMFSALQFGIVYFSRLGLSLSYFFAIVHCFSPNRVFIDGCLNVVVCWPIEVVLLLRSLFSSFRSCDLR